MFDLALILIGAALVVAVIYGLGYLHGWRKGNDRLFEEVDAAFRRERAFWKYFGNE